MMQPLQGALMPYRRSIGREEGELDVADVISGEIAFMFVEALSYGSAARNKISGMIFLLENIISIEMSNQGRVSLRHV